LEYSRSLLADLHGSDLATGLRRGDEGVGSDMLGFGIAAELGRAKEVCEGGFDSTCLAFFSLISLFLLITPTRSFFSDVYRLDIFSHFFPPTFFVVCIPCHIGNVIYKFLLVTVKEIGYMCYLFLSSWLLIHGL
jgi:hypothetical protein